MLIVDCLKRNLISLGIRTGDLSRPALWGLKTPSKMTCAHEDKVLKYMVVNPKFIVGRGTHILSIKQKHTEFIGVVSI